MRRPSRHSALRAIAPVTRFVRHPVRTIRRRRADPATELRIALDEAREQHARIADQARSAVASQKQAEARLNGKLAELARTTANARRALVLADQAAGDDSDRYARAAEVLAPQLVRLDADVESLTALVIETTRAVDRAKAAMVADAGALRERIVRAAKAAEQHDQAAMATSIDEVLTLLAATVGDDVPDDTEVERRIRRRHARARAAIEPGGGPVEPSDAEVEAAAADPRAAARLLELRDELGLSRGAAQDRRDG